MLAITFLLPVLGLLYVRLRKAPAEKRRPQLSLFYRCLSVLLAYMMLISPVSLQQLAQADIEYANLGISTWGADETVIEYGQWNVDYTVFTPGYDANGSLIKKIKWDTNGSADHSQWTQVEEVQYEYNLQNRLAKVTVDDGSVTVTEYKYDPAGNRVEKITDSVGTTYLIDAYNHTGYSQVFVETTGANKTAYIIGDDVLAQATGTGQTDVQYLLYDGHGSTRQLVDNAGTAVDDSFSYDAYGVLLGGQRPTQTNLLYTGEQYDSESGNYYLRARYYNPLAGLFNRMDPFAGSPQDSQSLHKYLYAHANPVNSIDPTGYFSLTSVVSAVTTRAILISSNAKVSQVEKKNVFYLRNPFFIV